MIFAFLCLSCKQGNIEKSKIDSFEVSKNDTQDQKDVRESSIIKFEDGETLQVVSNFFPRKPIDSFSEVKKKIKGKYFYCFKGRIDSKISEILEKNKEQLKINTAHSIIIKKDTIYFSEFNNVPCLKENDSILIKSIVYTFYQKGLKTNLLIIDDLIKK